jgi:hypothetical protein
MEQLDPRWRKASFSGNGGANCVEAGNAPGTVLVRDTTDRDGGTLSFTASAWRAFMANVKHS